MESTLLKLKIHHCRALKSITLLNRTLLGICLLCNIVISANGQLFKINYSIADSAHHYLTDFSLSKKTKSQQVSNKSNFDFGINFNILGYAFSKDVTMGASYFFDIHFYEQNGICKHGIRWYNNLSLGSDYMLSLSPGIVFNSSARNDFSNPYYSETLFESSHEISLFLTKNIGITSKIDVLHLRDKKDIVDISLGARCRGNGVNSIVGIIGLIASTAYMSILSSQ